MTKDKADQEDMETVAKGRQLHRKATEHDRSVQFDFEGFGNRLVLALKGESINAFAHRCGIGESLLRKYLKGSMPGMDKAAQIAGAVGVNLYWLITGEGPMRATEDAEINDIFGHYHVQPALDRDRLTQAIEIVNAAAAAKDAAWKARMAVAIYDLGDVPRAKKEGVVRAAL